MGMSSVWLVLTSVTGYVLTFVLLAKRLRLIAELRDTLSLPDAVAARYGSETTRLLTALAIALGVLGYLATQILAMATVLRDVLAGVPAIGAVSLPVCVAIACAVLAFYSITGGIIASVYTDMVQGAIMVVAALLVFLSAQAAVEGGFAGMSATLLADDPESIGPWGGLGMLACLSWYFLFLLGTAGQPHVITKLMMVRRLADAKRILPLSLLGYTLSALLWISVGLAMRALVLQGAHPELATPDAAAPAFLQHYASPILAGIVFAGLFAAIMSTADAFLNIGVAALVHDIPKALRGRPLERELAWARGGTAALTLVAAAFALYSHYANARLVALLGVFGAATFAAALVPTVALGFNWKRATAGAANAAIAVSLLLNLGIELWGVRLPYGIHGCPARRAATRRRGRAGGTTSRGRGWPSSGRGRVSTPVRGAAAWCRAASCRRRRSARRCGARDRRAACRRRGSRPAGRGGGRSARSGHAVARMRTSMGGPVPRPRLRRRSPWRLLHRSRKSSAALSGGGHVGHRRLVLEPSSGTWNEADRLKMALPCWMATTRRVVKERPSRMRSTS
jgi:Na+/proline symporter